MKTIVVLGANGNLGCRLVHHLRSHDVRIRCLLRTKSDDRSLSELSAKNMSILKIDFRSDRELNHALEGADVVVSTLAGLDDAFSLQLRVMQAAAKLGIPRFIPSDFAIDFLKIPPNSNRNLEFRKRFFTEAEKVAIKKTSILCGAFMDMLTRQAPFILFNLKRVLCWGNPDQLMDFTTVDNVAAYTAFAAVDDKEAPRFLRISGQEISANGLAGTMSRLTGKPFRILKPGNLWLFGNIIKLTKAFSREEQTLYPAWQGMQYMHNMYEGSAKFSCLDNERYPLKWDGVIDVLKKMGASAPESNS
jgi:nucleoside-diphosphate-sugar epimerase